MTESTISRSGRKPRCIRALSYRLPYRWRRVAYAICQVAFVVCVFSIAACSEHGFPTVPKITDYKPPVDKTTTCADGAVTIAVPDNKPPYFNGSSKDGIERDIINDAFGLTGKCVNFMEVAHRQSKYDSERFGVECVSTVSSELSLKSKSYFSVPVVTYHYTPFTLKKDHIVIKSYEDLAGKTVEAFSLARDYLGADFRRVIGKAQNYLEHENRSSQVALLLRGNVQVLVIDRTMFHFIRDALVRDRPDDYNETVLEVPVEINVDFKIACHHQALVDDFNKGIAALHANGRYGQIFDQYLQDVKKAN